MKKACISFIMVLIFLLLSGCNSNKDSGTVNDGDYVMEQALAGWPYIHISEGKIHLGDLTSSMLPNGTSGTYLIDDDILTMTTDDNKYIYAFQIDGNNLIFQKNESSPDDSIRIKITDNAKFHLIDD